MRLLIRIRDFLSKRKENKSNQENKLVNSSNNNIESVENNDQSEVKVTKKEPKTAIKVKNNHAPVTVNVTNISLSLPIEVTERLLKDKDFNIKEMLDNEYKTTPSEKLKAVKVKANSGNKIPELTPKIMPDEVKGDDKS